MRDENFHMNPSQVMLSSVLAIRGAGGPLLQPIEGRGVTAGLIRL